MRKASSILLLGALALAPQIASAQGFEGRPERRAAWLSDQLREQLWSYRQGLEFFQRAPEYQQLVELRFQIRQSAMGLGRPGSDLGSFHGEGRQMEQSARELYRLTRQLESRADLGSRDDVRRRADQLTEEAVEIRVLIGRLHEAIRLDYPGYRRSQDGRGAIGGPGLGAPVGRPGDRR